MSKLPVAQCGLTFTRFVSIIAEEQAASTSLPAPGLSVFLVSIFKGRHIYEDVIATTVIESKSSSEQGRRLKGTDFFIFIKVVDDT